MNGVVFGGTVTAMLGPNVPLSEKVLRSLCFITGTLDHVAKECTFKGLHDFGEEADDPKGHYIGVRRWTDDTRSEERSRSKVIIIEEVMNEVPKALITSPRDKA